ncbi:MAG: transketolase, partial [archaeon]|nr:transketolase [archaeon]
EMSYDITDPHNPENDEFVLSKGHAAPILYSCLYHAGAIKQDLLSLRKFDSPLEGHPMPGSLNYIKVGTGSLGQGLGIGVGMALASKKLGKKNRTFVLLGDSEMAEGSVYEAMQLGAYYKLDRLVAILDANRLGQSRETMVGHHVGEYEKRARAFGWDAIVIDGHDISQVLEALKAERKSSKPLFIIAKTFKGKGVSFLENKDGWHGKPVPKDRLEAALLELPDMDFPKVEIAKPKGAGEEKVIPAKMKFTGYKMGEEVATRQGYGSGLKNLAESNPRIIAIDAEVSNSTFSEKVRESEPDQYVEAFIGEQNMIGMALGMSVKGFVPYASTFAAFLSRAFDQIRMGALSSASFTVSGSHAGVSIGEDGASQMGLEDIAMFRTLPNAKVFYPSDANATEKIVELCSRLKGIKYIRTTRAKTPIIYSAGEEFPEGEFKVLKESAKDSVVLVGAGITLHEALLAHAKLKENGINSAVIDLYCVKPFNKAKFAEFAKKHGSKVVVAEDHRRAGGMGEMLAAAVSGFGIEVKSLGVCGIPHSGKPEELISAYGIDAKAIVDAAKKVAQG